jgi:hypothetical protein
LKIVQRFRQRTDVDPFDWVLLLLLFGLSVWVMIAFIVHQGPNAIWTGTNGPYVADQMNYLGWIEVSAKHVLISDPFITGASPSDYLHPGIAVSGLLVRLGMTPGWAYLFWDPIAVVVLFFGSRRFIRALIDGVWGRRIALILCLFYLSPAWAVLTVLRGTHWAPVSLLQSIDTEVWPVIYLWGYAFTAIAIGLMTFGLIAYDRARKLNRIGLAAPLLGLFCAWLQPWQGATLIGIVAISELIMWFRVRRIRLALPITMILATAAPLVYYSILSRVDWTWAVANRANLNLLPYLPWQAILISLAPLGLLAMFAYWSFDFDFRDLALRLWPLLAVAQYGVIYFTHIGTFPLHALDGLSVPLAVLAVLGARRIMAAFTLRGKAIVVTVGVLLLVVPSGVQELHGVWGVKSVGLLGPQPALITPSELDALQYLKNNPTEGAVLTSFYLGQTIPAETDRKTWIGAYSWTPDFFHRLVVSNQLFSGTLSPSAAEDLVRSSGARFLLSDCFNRADLSTTLSDLITSVHHFGCATVYELQPDG